MSLLYCDKESTYRFNDNESTLLRFNDNESTLL